MCLLFQLFLFCIICLPIFFHNFYYLVFLSIVLVSLFLSPHFAPSWWSSLKLFLLLTYQHSYTGTLFALLVALLYSIFSFSISCISQFPFLIFSCFIVTWIFIIFRIFTAFHLSLPSTLSTLHTAGLTAAVCIFLLVFILIPLLLMNILYL